MRFGEAKEYLKIDKNWKLVVNFIKKQLNDLNVQKLSTKPIVLKDALLYYDDEDFEL